MNAREFEPKVRTEREARGFLSSRFRQEVFENDPLWVIFEDSSVEKERFEPEVRTERSDVPILSLDNIHDSIYYIVVYLYLWFSIA